MDDAAVIVSIRLLPPSGIVGDVGNLLPIERNHSRYADHPTQETDRGAEKLASMQLIDVWQTPPSDMDGALPGMIQSTPWARYRRLRLPANLASSLHIYCE